MDTKVISTGVRYTSLLDSYVRPEADRPKLSEVQDCDDVPIIDLGSEDRTSIVQQIGNACLLYVFFQVINHRVSMEAAERMQEVAHEFFRLPVEEKMKLYSDDPAKTMRLSTSFNPEQLENQPELSWSTENPTVVLATIAALIALAGVKFQNASENPFHSRPATTTFIVIALLIYSFAAAQTRSIILDGKQQQILMWCIIYYYYRLLNSLVQISKVVCQACIVSLIIPYGPGWNVYVACASTSCFGVAVWAILRNFAPSCVVWLVLCMGPTGSSGGSEKNDGVSDCGNDGRNRIAESNGSPVCGFSLVSENQSSSQQGKFKLEASDYVLKLFRKYRSVMMDLSQHLKSLESLNIYSIGSIHYRIWTSSAAHESSSLGPRLKLASFLSLQVALAAVMLEAIQVIAKQNNPS
ncbi:hypothetical protein RHGRI_002711 [Rhododendron griersonianum]|uniref:Non-haem dioxygenase N-terminal domain-containing protein n=1 Tax=Rhododendron griersonianum TaxID=479676 RepID=A0AAV6LRA2_9ERIC|nr:hypothetical protein RHGRI_002711 [Rhododendron griersonianum]